MYQRACANNQLLETGYLHHGEEEVVVEENAGAFHPHAHHVHHLQLQTQEEQVKVWVGLALNITSITVT